MAKLKMLLSIILLAILGQQAFASPSTLTYQGRIVKSNGEALEFNNVGFIFELTSPNGSCVIYREQKVGVNMVNSGGIFDVAIGTGSRQYPSSGTSRISDYFDNTKTYNCGDIDNQDTGSTYSAVSGDGRRLRVSFWDGSGWQVISPDNEIRSVPYASYSLTAEKIGTISADNVARKSDLPAADCSANEVLTFTGGAFSCVPDQAGASGFTPLDPANNLSDIGDAAVARANLGLSTAGGDLSGSLPNPTIAKLQSKNLTLSSLANKQVLFYDGGQWINKQLSISDISGVTMNDYVGYSAIPANCAASKTMVFITPSNTFSCSDIAISTSQVSGLAASATTDATNASNITSGTLDAARLPSSITDALWTASSGNMYRSSGNVGIGTNSPNAKLEINSGTANVSGLRLTNLVASSPVSTGQPIGVDASGNIVTVASGSETPTCSFTANIGNQWPQSGWTDLGSESHGTLASCQAFAITKSASAFYFSNSGNYPICTVGNGTPTSFYSQYGGGCGSGNCWPNTSRYECSTPAEWLKAGSDVVRAGGKVGIGTLTPASPLEVWRSGTMDSTFTGTSAGTLRLVGGNYVADGFTNLDFMHSYSGHHAIGRIGVQSGSGGSKMIFGTSSNYVNGIGNTAMTIDHLGRIGIGTTSPSNALYVKSSDRTVSSIEGESSDFTEWRSYNSSISTLADGNLWSLMHAGSSPLPSTFGSAANTPAAGSFSVFQHGIGARITVSKDGYVGIGVPSPTARLHVNGSALATAWNTSSDERLKEKIQTIQNPLDKILSLRGVEFDWRRDVNAPTKHEDLHDIGVIAQEVEKVFPEAVTSPKDGYKAVAYSKLVAPLIESVKALYYRLTGVEDRLNAQAEELEDLRKKNALLTQENELIRARLENIERSLSSK